MKIHQFGFVTKIQGKLVRLESGSDTKDTQANWDSHALNYVQRINYLVHKLRRSNINKYFGPIEDPTQVWNIPRNFQHDKWISIGLRNFILFPSKYRSKPNTSENQIRKYISCFTFKKVQ